MKETLPAKHHSPHLERKERREERREERKNPPDIQNNKTHPQIPK